MTTELEHEENFMNKINGFCEIAFAERNSLDFMAFNLNLISTLNEELFDIQNNILMGCLIKEGLYDWEGYKDAFNNYIEILKEEGYDKYF